MIRTFLLLAFTTSLFALESVDCNQIFEMRKSELIMELDKISKEQRELEAMRSGESKALDAKKEELVKIQQDIDGKLAKIEESKEAIDKLYKKNQKVLADIKKTKGSKLVDLYSKMKAGPAAVVLDTMDVELSSSILFKLNPKKASAIMAKMQPAKASAVTMRLEEGPPFKITKK